MSEVIRTNPSLTGADRELIAHLSQFSVRERGQRFKLLAHIGLLVLSGQNHFSLPSGGVTEVPLGKKEELEPAGYDLAEIDVNAMPLDF